MIPLPFSFCGFFLLLLLLYILSFETIGFSKIVSLLLFTRDLKILDSGTVAMVNIHNCCGRLQILFIRAE